MLRRVEFVVEFWQPLLVCTLLGIVAVGCGQGTAAYEGVPVKGTVTLDGKPLDEGEIQFKTVATGALDTIPIQAGQFSGTAQAGQKRVEIFAFKTAAPPPSTVPGPPPEVQKTNYLPARYNTASTLSAEVKSAGPNEFKFEVTSR